MDRLHPYSFTFDKNARVLCLTFEGRFSRAEFMVAHEKYQHHADATRPVAVIWNFTGVTVYNVSSDEIRYMANIPVVYAPGIPRFAVAPTDLGYGILRMYQIMAEGRLTLHVLRTTEEAFAIMGITNPRFERL